MVIIKIKW